MKVQELRIGNVIEAECYNSGTIEKHIVKEIFSNSVMITIDKRFLPEDSDLHRIMEGSSSEYKSSDIQPIPLTEEVLLKCGFEELNGLSDVEHITRFSKNLIFQIGKSQNDKFMYGLTNGVVYIKYLHQLQNLYFDITNEELKFMEE